MRIQKIVAAGAAGSLLLASAGVFAQAERNQELLDQRQYDQQHGYRAGDPRAANTGAMDYQGNANRGVDSHDRGHSNQGPDRFSAHDQGSYRVNDWRHDGRGAGPNHDWVRGNRLPAEYRSRQYVVDDWRAHHLYAPPRGYQWVQAGSDYVLVAVATGIIASILLSH